MLRGRKGKGKSCLKKPNLRKADGKGDDSQKKIQKNKVPGDATSRRGRRS